MSLHLRLALRYAAVLLAALLLLAVLAVVTIDRALRSNLDGRLRTEAFATASLVDTVRGNAKIDGDDRKQFLTIMQSGEQAIVTDNAGHVVFSSVTLAPDAIVAAARHAAGVYDADLQASQARAAVEPVVRDGVRAGTVVVWRPADWIAQADRGASLAFLAAALIIAVLALGAGSFVTRRALEDALERQRRFTSAASHELRAPLAVIRAEADLALRKERTSAEYAATLKTIAAETDALESLTADLLAAARAEYGETSRTPFDATGLVRTVAARLSPLAQTKGVVITADGAEQLYAVGDAAAIERSILALAHNALKYAPENGTVTLQAYERGGGVEISVDDDGPGFSESSLAHAFEPFWRDGSARMPGSGLGLALAKAVINASGGSIALANCANGAHVVVRLRAR